jgi:5,10-methylenetetrahydromethanopterin reductase
MGTIDEIAKGRTILGLGAGITGFNALHIKRRKPAKAIREAVHVIRELFTGKTVTYEGELVKIKECEIDFETRPDIPIYIAGRGPKILEMAGELAEGAIIGALASKAGLNYAFGQIKKGMEKSGKTRKAVETVLWVYTSISENDQAAFDAVRPISSFFVRSCHYIKILDKIGISETIAQPILDTLGTHTGSSERMDNIVLRAAKLVPDTVITKCALVGTADDIIERVSELEKLGVKQIAVLPFAPRHESTKDVIQRFGEEVIPQFK